MRTYEILLPLWMLYLLKKAENCFHHWSHHQLHRAGLYKPLIYMAYLLIEQQRKQGNTYRRLGGDTSTC